MFSGVDYVGEARYYQELARSFSAILHTMVIAQPAPYAGRIEDRLPFQDAQRTYSKVARQALWSAIHAAKVSRDL